MFGVCRKNRSWKPVLFLGSFLVLSVFSVGSVEAKFADVPEDHIYFEAISDLESRKVVQRRENFYPDRFITRAEFYKIIFNYVGFVAETGENQTVFADVAANDWFAGYVNKAYDLHLVKFQPANPNFHPGISVRRSDALRAIFSLFGVSNPKVVGKGTLQCTDVFADDPDRHLFVTAEKMGLFDSISDRRCVPSKVLTRGEMADLILRVNKFLEVNGGGFMPVAVPELRTEDKKVSVGENGLEITLSVGGDDVFLDNTKDVLGNDRFNVFLSVWSEIHRQYVFQDKVDDNELIYGAVKGMVNTLKDPHSEFQNPAEAQAFDDSLNGTFQGIGTSVDMVDGSFTIVAPLKGSPAEKAGLKSGDVILEVDGKGVVGLSADEIIALIKGPEGSSVKLLIKRGESVFTKDVVRNVIELPSIESELKGADVAYLQITVFTEDTAERFMEEMKKLNLDEVGKLVIDLRHNPGGYLDATLEILNHFVPKGKKTARIELGDGRVEEYFSEGPAEFADLKIVILVNEGSASASEILAGSLQDHGLARIVGVKTFGKGTVQQVLEFSDGSQLKLSVANWFTPNGRNLNEIGLEPDVVVEDGGTPGEDLQLRKAIELLQ